MSLAEERTHEVAQLLREAFQNAPVGMALEDTAGRVLWSNPALRDMLGYGEEELRGMFRTEFTHSDDLGEDARLYEELLRGERESFRSEERYLRKDGGVAWGRLSAFRVEPLDLVLVVVEDLDERKDAEEELAASERRFRTVIEQAPLSVHVFEPEGRSLRANLAWYELWNLGEEERPEGRNVYEDERLRATGLVPYIEESTRKGAQVRTPPLLYDPAATGRQGPARWLEAAVYPVKDEEGRVFEMALLIDDITEQREAEGRLREAEARYRNVVESLGEGLLITDLEDVVVYANPRMVELTGHGVGEMIGRRAYEMLLPQEQWDAARQRNRERARGRADRYEARLRRKDGTFLWAAVSAAPYRDPSGEIVGTVGAFADVTERREAEQAVLRSERNLAEAQRIAHVGHWEHDYADGRVYWSDELYRIFGLVPGGVRPTWEAFLRVVHPDDRDYVREAFIDALREGGADDTKYRVVRPNGELRVVHNRREIVLDETERPVRVSGTVQDVTEREEAERALREAEKRYRTLVEQIPAVTYIDRADGTDEPLYTSPQIEGMLGYTPEEWLAGGLWPERLHPDDRERILAADARFEEGEEEHFGEEYRLLAKDGRVVWVREEAVLIKDDAGEPLLWQGIIIDVSEQKEAEARLREAEERYRALVENVPTVAYTQELGDHRTAVYVSPRIRDLTGYDPKDFEADPDLWYAVVHPDDRQRVEAEDKRTEDTGEPFRVEYRVVHRDGRVLWVRDESVLVRAGDEAPLYWQGVMSDITEARTFAEQLQHQAMHDPLTGLPNRVLLEDRLRLALKRARRRRGEVAVLFVDLDNFKVVNDSLGHEAGDRLLIAVAKRLRAIVRPEDTVARLGGDEFIFLLEDAGLERAAGIAERILTKLGSPVALKGRRVYATASIGMALGGAETERAEDLLRDADLAMYRAKLSGKARYAVFEEGMNRRALERLELEQDLRRALERGEFEVYYQPKVSLQTGRVVGFEALLRWHHPDRGPLPPDEFVPLAEETGLIIPIGERVLEQACRQSKEWHELHPDQQPVAVCVNLSAKQFREPGLPEVIARVLDETGLVPNRLYLEVTESAAMKEAATTTLVLEELKALGVRAIIDDFGTGYSSLSYLGRFPVDYVKIDRSFVGGLGEDSLATLLAKGVIDLTHALGLKVIAEGVETDGQLGRLKEMGCDLAQGYYFSEPLTGSEAKEWLTFRYPV